MFSVRTVVRLSGPSLPEPVALTAFARQVPPAREVAGLVTVAGSVTGSF